MNYERHYIQFNDFVFDQYDMISDDSTSTSFKTNKTAYGFTHGSYSPSKQRSGLVEAGRLALTITLQLKKLPCEVRKYYLPFALSQLSNAGKLWAVENDRLIWAYAKVTSAEKQKSGKRNTIEIDVDFSLPEGVWHKADKQKTFLVPYDSCDFMDCYGYKDIDPCFDGDCCNCGTENPIDTCDCCECLEREMALCFHKDDLQSFYSRCGSGYRIVYDCNAAERLFGGYFGVDHLGTKFCADSTTIAGQLYSDTDVPTEGVKITLRGKVKNPYIEINGNGNQIKGEYDGTLTINPNGSVYYADECCDKLLPVGAWSVPGTNDYKWQINPGNNRVIIQPGECCGLVCAYIQVDSLTI